MRSRFYLALAVALAVVPMCAAGIRTSRFAISLESRGRDHWQRAFLAARERKLILVQSTVDEVFGTRNAPTRWYITGTRIKSSVGGRYLAYDPSGQSTKVYLLSRPGKGTDWTVGIDKNAEEGLRGKNAEEGLRGTIRAAAGKLKGWYLSMEVHKKEDGEGRTVTVHRFILSRAPGRKFEAERIFVHK
jgi:hypothetical protein